MSPRLPQPFSLCGQTVIAAALAPILVLTLTMSPLTVWADESGTDDGTPQTNGQTTAETGNQSGESTGESTGTTTDGTTDGSSDGASGTSTDDASGTSTSDSSDTSNDDPTSIDNVSSTIKKHRAAIVSTCLKLATGTTAYTVKHAKSKRTKPLCRAYNSAKKKVIGKKTKIYASCDVAISVVMRYSKVDTSYPIKPCKTQAAYLKFSSKWTYVGTYNEATGAGVTLEPGDVLMYTASSSEHQPNHTRIYLGSKAVKSKYPKAGSSYVWFEASYKHYYPTIISTAKRHRILAKSKIKYHTFKVYRLMA